MSLEFCALVTRHVQHEIALSITNTVNEKDRLRQDLELFGQSHRLPAPLRDTIDLCLEEHLTNIITYGYLDSKAHAIHVRCCISDTQVEIEIKDDARPFNPNAYPVDTSLPLHEKPMGGVGILLLRRLMDTVEYHRSGNKNIVTLKKRISDAD